METKGSAEKTWVRWRAWALWAALMVLGGVSGEAHAQELRTLLAEGPVVTVHRNAKGRFRSVTALAWVEAPAETVYRVAADLASNKTMMPQMIRSDTTKVKENVYDVEFEVEVPGSNPEYEMRFVLDPKERTVIGRWTGGDLKGSSKSWRFVPYGDGTIIYYTTVTRNFSALARRFEGKQQAVTVGVNVTGALAGIEAVKGRAERLAKAEKAEKAKKAEQAEKRDASTP